MNRMRYLDWMVVIPSLDARAKTAVSVVEVVIHWNACAVWWNPCVFNRW